MLKIGEFSKLSRVSVRMLRHYDEIGLLKPAEIDRFTDYRYYREDQLPVIGRITALKDMDFFMNRCKIMNDTLAWDLTGKNDPTRCIDIDPETLYALEHTGELDEAG